MPSVTSEATEFSLGSVKLTWWLSPGVEARTLRPVTVVQLHRVSSTQTDSSGALHWRASPQWKAIDNVGCAGGNESEALSVLGQKILANTDICC